MHDPLEAHAVDAQPATGVGGGEPSKGAPWATIAELLDAVTTGERASLEAVVDGPHRLTFGELAEAARRVAGALHDGLKVRRGDRVAIWAPNRWEWVVAACGAWWCGATVVPISTRYRAVEAGEILERTRASLLVVSGPFLGVDYISLLEGLYGGPADGQRFQGLPHLREVVVIGDAVGADGQPYERVGAFEDLRSHPPLPGAAERPEPDDDCEILFTSGTTGQPKGVRLSHRQILDNYWSYGLTAGFRRGDRYLVVVPFGHGGGINGCTMTCLIHGITNVPVVTFDPASALGLIERERISIVMGPPQLHSQIFHAPDVARHDISSIRVAITGSAVTPPELIEELRGHGIERVINAYGLIEGSAVSMTRAGDPDGVISTTVGRPLPYTEVRVVDEDGGGLPPEVAGEVLVRGPGVMQGYLDAPDLTAEAVDDAGWLHTGDAGVLDEAGNLRIIDRKKEMYIVSGFNVYPAEVERLLLLHGDVAAAAVVAVAPSGAAETGYAFVVRAPGSTATDADVQAWAKEHMAGYKVPRFVELVDDIPLNPTGKADRKLLKQLASERVSTT